MLFKKKKSIILKMIITTTEELINLCDELKKEDFITLDTEFIREKTYYPELCLIQIAGLHVEACIDALSEGLDLTALFELLQNPSVVKVFHAAHQDVEIFFHMTGKIPHPLFDTQVAAMVCGYGESVGYQQLVHDIVGVSLDKSMRFTDWKRRPLNKAQIDYALRDVTYLRDIYLAFHQKLKETGREHWLSQELEIQNNPKTYETDDNEVWRKIKIPFKKPLQAHIFAKLCAWRERTAKVKNIPRKYVVKDDALIELAVVCPTSVKEMDSCRNLSKGFGKNAMGIEILSVIQAAMSDTPDCYPENWKPKKPLTATQHTLVELFRLLLSIQCASFGVAPKIVASTEELQKLACGDNDVACLTGWRQEIFGEKALLFRQGKISFCFNPKTHQPELKEC